MKFEQSVSIAAKPEEVFSTFKKVSEWPIWDHEVESSSIDGEFSVGTTGKIKPKGAPESKILLTKVTENKSFTVECGLPLCKMHFIHLIDKTETGTNLINSVEFTGLLSPLFSRIIGKGINKTLPESLQSLKKHIEAVG